MSTRINGRALARELSMSLKHQVEHLAMRKIIPALTVIKIGSDAASESYIERKRRAAANIGIRLETTQFLLTANPQEITDTIDKFNNDPRVHAIIIQRPIPVPLNNLDLHVTAHKDADGFEPNSPYLAPIAMAIFYILQAIYQTIDLSVLDSKRIVIIGKGQTAGKPIANAFTRKKIKVDQVDSKTPDKEKLLKNADIIISCVGKRGTLKGNTIKKGAIVIGVGINREDNKLYGDFDETDIAHKASFYTPTPGGTGPLNVAFLMKNVILATNHDNFGN